MMTPTPKPTYEVKIPGILWPAVFKPQDINGHERFSVAWRDGNGPEVTRAQTRIRPLLLPVNDEDRDEFVRVYEQAKALNLVFDSILWDVPATLTLQDYDYQAPGGETGTARGLVAVRVKAGELDKGFDRAIARRLQVN